VIPYVIPSPNKIGLRRVHAVAVILPAVLLEYFRNVAETRGNRLVKAPAGAALPAVAPVPDVFGPPLSGGGGVGVAILSKRMVLSRVMMKKAGQAVDD
jgi:hypothetical protein